MILQPYRNESMSMEGEKPGSVALRPESIIMNHSNKHESSTSCNACECDKACLLKGHVMGHCGPQMCYCAPVKMEDPCDCHMPPIHFCELCEIPVNRKDGVLLFFVCWRNKFPSQSYIINHIRCERKLWFVLYRIYC